MAFSLCNEWNNTRFFISNQRPHGKKRCYCDTLSVEKKMKKTKIKRIGSEVSYCPFEKKLDKKNRCVKL